MHPSMDYGTAAVRVYVSVLEYLVVEEFGSLLESKYLHWIQVLMNESAKL